MSEVISLDEHRLLCGNAQVKEDVDKLLDGVQVDLLLTDPPYGIDIVNPVGGGKLEDKEVHQLDHSTHTHTHAKWHNRRSETSNIQEEQWEYLQDQGSRERERERANGKVGKPRRCPTKTLQTSNR